MTPAFLERLGRAAARVLPPGEVLLARDTRGSGPMLEAALASGLLFGGRRVRRLGVLPTAALAQLVRVYGAAAGAVISASHNPYWDNGVKFFAPEGKKIPDELEAAIEAALEAPGAYTEGGALLPGGEAEAHYLRHLEGLGAGLTGLRVVVDAANGAAFHVGPEALRRAGAEVFAIGTSPDGRNINAGLGATAPETMARLVRELGYDVGVAFDGDADRAIFADRHGRIAHGDHVLYLHALLGGEPGVVGTTMTNLGLEKALAAEGIALYRAPVGDRFVARLLEEKGLHLGGEQSGHVIFRRHGPTGDGVQTALLTLARLKASGSDLADWVERLKLFPQRIENARVADKQRVMGHPRLKALIAEAERRLGEGRVNVRPSGTEPVVRVMVEGPEAALVAEVAAWLRQAIEDLN